MAVPEYVPVEPGARVHFYESPDHVPAGWRADRPADIVNRQPEGSQLGFQGPDQGYGLLLANRFRDRLHLLTGEHADDVIAGVLGIALRRASSFGRAPVSHDFTIAFTIWGFLDSSAHTELVAARRPLFEGLANVHHYPEARDLVERVPEATLRMTPDAVRDAYDRGGWKSLLGF